MQLSGAAVGGACVQGPIRDQWVHSGHQWGGGVWGLDPCDKWGGDRNSLKGLFSFSFCSTLSELGHIQNLRVWT